MQEEHWDSHETGGSEQSKHHEHSHHEHSHNHHSHHKHKHHHRKKWYQIFGMSRKYVLKDNRNKKSDLMKAGIVCVSIMIGLVAVAGGLDVLKQREDTAHLKEVSQNTVDEENGTSSGTEDTILVDGTYYQKKRQIETYLFMGIDVDSESKSAGQADTQMLLVFDKENKTWQLAQLNRDSMVTVPILGLDGKVIGYEEEQLALAHSYGDGKEESCENNVWAVSNLFGGQKIDGYLSLSLDGIAVLNDAVGGVTLQVTSDFSQVDDSLTEGEWVTLTGEQAVTFVRTRKGVDDQTNLARMSRQRQYLNALSGQLSELDENKVLEVYDEVHDYIVTDMGSAVLVNLFNRLNQYEELEILTIDGENVVEDDVMAYHLDDDSLQQVMLELFYEKVQEE